MHMHIFSILCVLSMQIRINKFIHIALHCIELLAQPCLLIYTNSLSSTLVNTLATFGGDPGIGISFCNSTAGSQYRGTEDRQRGSV